MSELRERQRRKSITSPVDSFGTPPLSPVYPRQQTWLRPELVKNCITTFLDQVYPTQPILDRITLEQDVHTMYQDVQSYCLVVSLCAYMLIQPHMQLPESVFFSRDGYEAASTDRIALELLQDVLEARKAINYVESPSLQGVITSFFLFGCYFCLEKNNTAWFHLREATTLALLLNMHKEESYNDCDPHESVRKRRLFWLLFVTERAYALQSQRPLTLHATIDLPEVQQTPDDESDRLIGFNHLILLYRPFDDTFVGLWNQSIQQITTVEWISNLQDQLSDALPRYLRSTESQAVDLKTSHQWLRVMIWQLSISQKLLSSNAQHEAMTLTFPLELSRQLVAEASHFSKESMEVHGIGLVKKLFDVTSTLIDVMSCVPIDPGLSLGPRHHLHHFIQLIGTLRGGQERYLPLVLAKANDQLPGWQGSIQRGLPSSIGRQLDNQPLERIQYDGLTMSPLRVSSDMTALKIETTEIASVSPYAALPLNSRSEDTSYNASSYSGHRGSFHS